MPSPPPRSNFSISVEADDTAHVVRVAGELDIHTRDQLASTLAGLAKPPMIVILDFSDLTFVDSIGLRTVLSEHRRAKAEQYEFVIAGANGAVREVFRITALDITLPLVPDVAAVLGD